MERQARDAALRHVPSRGAAKSLIRTCDGFHARFRFASPPLSAEIKPLEDKPRRRGSLHETETYFVASGIDRIHERRSQR